MNIDYADLSGLAEGITEREHRLLDQLDRMESSVLLLLDTLRNNGVELPKHVDGHVSDDLTMVGQTLLQSGFNAKHYDCY